MFISIDHKVFVPARPTLIEKCFIHQQFASCSSAAHEEWMYTVLKKRTFELMLSLRNSIKIMPCVEGEIRLSNGGKPYCPKPKAENRA